MDSMEDFNLQVSVIILHFGDPRITCRCIESIARGTCLPRIILVDNDPVNRCRIKGYDGLVYLPQERNLGFAAGVNIGIRRALELKSEVVILLNNDVEVDSHALKRAVDKVLTHGAVVGAVEFQLSRQGRRTFRVIFAGGTLVWREVAVKINLLPDHAAQPFTTDFIRGSFMAMSRQTIVKVGEMDESFVSYLEDVDYCIRSVQAGYSLLMDPGVKIWHRVSHSTSIYYRNYHMSLNYLKLLKKHASGINLYRGFAMGGIAAMCSIVNARRYGKLHGFVHGVLKMLKCR